ncbi:hypothetical protein LIER_22093 [Lithospermum erythrorhizon]|uniref:Retrotransposon gag protein n=1 Tax=Lithospermum erythrorhizon TaxID=34254 RepID=A0AAV3QSR8_LITER
MEVTIGANKGKGTNTSTTTPYKAKYETKKPKDTSKVEKKDAYVVTSKSTKFSFKTKRTEGGLNLGDKKRLTLNEMQAKEYPFFESDILDMFEKLLKAKLIELLEPKRLEEANRRIEPDYCRYHRVHPIENCFVFKEKVIDLALQGSILLEEDKDSANHITLTIIKLAGVKVLAAALEAPQTPPEVPRPSQSPSLMKTFHKKMVTTTSRSTEEPEAPKVAQPNHPSIDEEVIEALEGLMLPLTQAKEVASTTLKGFMTPVTIPPRMQSWENCHLRSRKQGIWPKRSPEYAKMKRVLHQKLHSWTRIHPSVTIAYPGQKVVDHPQTRIGKVPPRKNESHQQWRTPKKWEAVPWQYPTKQEKVYQRSKEPEA